MPRYRWSRLADFGVLVFLLVSVAAGGAAIHYHGERLAQEAAKAKRGLLQADADHALDHLAHTLNTVDLTLRSLLETGYANHSAATWQALLNDALRHAPYLRSLSLLDDHGRIQVSSNPANLGLDPSLDDYLPHTGMQHGALRIGRLHVGSDLNDGQAVDDPATTPPTTGYIPVVRGIALGESGALSLLATVDAGYFLDHLDSHHFNHDGWLDLLRSDGALLFSSRKHTLDPAVHTANATLVMRWQAGEHDGSMDESPGDRTLITHWKRATNLPLAIIARSDYQQAVAPAAAESRRQLMILLPLAALALCGMLAAYLAIRREARRHFAAQGREFERMARVLDALPASVLLFGESGRTLLTNQAWQHFASTHRVEVPRGALHYRDYAQLLQPVDGSDGLAEDGIGAVLSARQPAFDGEFVLCGSQRTLRLMARAFDHDGLRGVVVLQLDVTDQHRAEERNRLLHAALDAAANAIVITDPDGRIEWANPAFETLTGYPPAEAIGRNPRELIRSGRHDAAFYRTMWQTIMRGEVWRGEMINKRRSGELYDEELTITPVVGRDGRPAHFIAVKEDVTERKQQVRELKRLASVDPLTGVTNRRAFMEHLTLELARVRRYGEAAALLMLDLDHFKRVNDLHGHAAGDIVLRAFTERTAAELRQTDTLGRLGGEEFAVLLPETDEEGARELAERIRVGLVEHPVMYGELSIQVTVSTGIALLETTDQHPDAALVRADDALYRAKQRGRNRVEITTTMD
jgi:diguanylate cyclase (GGDEF)-like protein/PAS domain S-box-containing protein